MNKMIVAVFKDEPSAYEGLRALKDLHKDGDITLYAASVIVKDPSGAIGVKQAADRGPVGTAVGMLTGALAGLLGGPVGAVMGASVGGLTGALVDLSNAGISVDFVDEISKALTPGKAAVVADVEESWTTPVDTRIGQLGGTVYRRLRSEFVEDQLTRETNESRAELGQLEDEFKHAGAENKAAIQKQMDAVKSKIETLNEQAKSRATQLKEATEAREKSLHEQMRQANERRKERIQKRMSEVDADYKARMAKFRQVEDRAQEALHH